jgi:hypothetical protein
LRKNLEERLGRSSSKTAPAILASLLAAITWINVVFYFRHWANDARVWADFSVAETNAGRRVAAETPGTLHRVAGRFLNHFSFRFLAYDRLPYCEPLEPSSFLRPPPQGVEWVRYTLDSNQSGLFAMLRGKLPGGEESIVRDPWRRELVISYSLPATAWNGVRDDGTGLRARFYVSAPSGPRLFLERVDKLVEYPNGNDFPHPQESRDKEGPVWGRWTGDLDITKSGDYLLEVDSYQDVSIWLDGLRLFVSMGKGSKELRFGQARHKIEIRYPIVSSWNNRLTVSCRAKDASTRNSREARFFPGR